MNLRIHHITWNVASTYPMKTEKYYDLFSIDKSLNYKHGEYPDFYVISLQEQTINLLENYWETTFKELFKKIRNDKGVVFVKLRSHSILYLNQYIFVKLRFLLTCKSLETIKFTNYGGLNGKGTIAFKFKIDNESFCFLSAHLSAHDYGNEERINHYNRVIKDDNFFDFSRILTCSFAFYAGDLNFRLIDLDTIELINDLNEKGKDHKFIEDLLNKDQLKIAQKNSEAFAHFSEGDIRFRPTFKFHLDSTEYNPKRTPSWCDRILYRSRTYKPCKLLYYNSIEKYIQSDHKPVIAIFELDTQIKSVDNIVSNVRILSTNKTDVDNKLDVWVNKKVKKDFKFNLLISANEPNDQKRTEETDSVKNGWDWIGLFKEDFDDLDDYLAYLYVEDVQCNTGPPEEIVMKMCNIEKADEAFELEKAKEIKEGETLEELPSTSSLTKIEDSLKEVKKKLEWSKLEFSEQTFTQPGKYVLIYFNGDRSVEYISEPFEVVSN